MRKKVKRVLLSGNEAVARGAYEAGCGFAAAYPGTPSTEILESIAGYRQVDAQWSVNEKVAYEVALGAAISGVRALYASKHVGVNVAMDPLMTSAYTGINAGLVVVSCDDPGMHSSQNEQDNRLIARFAKIPLLEPSSPGEALDMVKQAYRISERFDIPVMLRMTTRIAHSKEDMALSARKTPHRKKLSVDIPKYVMIPGNARKRRISLENRLRKLTEFSEKTSMNKVYPGTDRHGFITSGVSFHYVRETFPDAPVLKLGMSYPFPDGKIKEFAGSVRKVTVVEESEPFIEEHVRSIGVRTAGKHGSFGIGELRPEDIPVLVKGLPAGERFSRGRRPRFCPGCPHAAVFSILKKLKVVVSGDIGCYALAALPPYESLHTCICMGDGLTGFEGMNKGAGRKKVVGVLGDSTFVHSGITGLINAVYNGQKGLVIILDNSTTAMTGGQPNPATGVTLKGTKHKRLVLEDICRACGADNVDVVDPFKVKKLETMIKRRLEEKKLTVIIARSPCRLIK